MGKKKEEKEKQELVKELTKQMQKLDELDSIEKFIKDNKIKFEYGDEIYRVRKPNYAERESIRKARTRKYVELLEEDGYIFKKHLIEKLKKKGINIPKMEREIGILQEEMDDVRERLAPIEDKKIQEKLKNEIKNLLEKQQELNIEITNCLEPCIENELDEYVNIFAIYTLLERKNENKWEKAFNSLEDFKKVEDEGLIANAAYYTSLILFDRGLTENEE